MYNVIAGASFGDHTPGSLTASGFARCPLYSISVGPLIEGVNMKKAPLILLLFASLAVAAHSQSSTDRERDGLKGSVQTVRVRKTTTLDENGVRTETPLLLSHVVTYDKWGSKTELALYDGSGTLSRRIVYTDEPGNKRKSGVITYDSNNSMVRKIVDTYGKNGFEKNRTIEDFNEDGTVYRKLGLTFNSLGEMTEVAEYGADGTLIKTERAPFKEPEREYIVGDQRRPLEDVDRVVSFGSGGGEYFDPDPHGNWTRGLTASTSRTYSSGKKIKTTEVVYREFTYY